MDAMHSFVGVVKDTCSGGNGGGTRPHTNVSLYLYYVFCRPESLIGVQRSIVGVHTVVRVCAVADTKHRRIYSNNEGLD